MKNFGIFMVGFVVTGMMYSNIIDKNYVERTMLLMCVEANYSTQECVNLIDQVTTKQTEDARNESN